MYMAGVYLIPKNRMYCSQDFNSRYIGIDLLPDFSTKQTKVEVALKLFYSLC